ncbi:MAG TPA: PAS domain S-box protein, partial [Chitinophagales bacterium]|nr:PAS domain S-box protein [Chitinophagales bacterium]
MEKSLPLYKRITDFFRNETYWKERVIGVLGLGMYFFGNLIEIASSPTHSTTDPPVVWVTGTIIAFALLGSSFTKYRRFTSTLFKVFVYFVNFNVILGYGDSTKGTVDSQAFYLFISYAIFIVTSQMLESRRELLTITAYEIALFVGAVYVNRDNHTLLLQPTQQLMLAFVLVGNIAIGLQRMRLTQISGDSSIQFKAISENARDSQSIITAEYNFLYTNPSIIELTGYSFNQLNGKKFLTMVAENDQEQVLQALNRVKNSPDERQSVEYRVKSAEGDYIWVESILSAFKVGRKGKT